MTKFACVISQILNLNSVNSTNAFSWYSDTTDMHRIKKCTEPSSSSWFSSNQRTISKLSSMAPFWAQIFQFWKFHTWLSTDKNYARYAHAEGVLTVLFLHLQNILSNRINFRASCAILTETSELPNSSKFLRWNKKKNAAIKD